MTTDAPLSTAHISVTGREEKLAFARHKAELAGKKLTPLREHVYLRLVEEGPLGAYELLERLDGVASAKPPTAYRALEFLLELGLIRKLKSVSKYIATLPDRTTGPSAFVVCRVCGIAEQLRYEAPATVLLEQAEQNGFRELDPTIEISGHCGKPDCPQTT